tara:strand:- start:335 stop:547 length:213 start_codon:yes stop_codon:yes gene_type:complete
MRFPWQIGGVIALNGMPLDLHKQKTLGPTGRIWHGHEADADHYSRPRSVGMRHDPLSRILKPNQLKTGLA